MAVLIGIVAPAMLRYVEKAKLAQANYNAKVVYDFVEYYIIECYVNNNFDLSDTITIPIYKYDAETMSVSYNGRSDDLGNYLRMCFDSDEDKSEADYVVITFTSTLSTAADRYNDIELISATWAAKPTDDMVGSYPTPAVGRATELSDSYRKFNGKYFKYYKPNLGDQ